MKRPDRRSNELARLNARSAFVTGGPNQRFGEHLARSPGRLDVLADNVGRLLSNRQEP